MRATTQITALHTLNHFQQKSVPVVAAETESHFVFAPAFVVEMAKILVLAVISPRSTHGLVEVDAQSNSKLHG